MRGCQPPPMLGVREQYLMTTCYWMCMSQTFADHRLTSLGTYQTLGWNISQSSEIAVHAFITSKLDYCNSLLYSCRKTHLKKVQYVQNTAARIVTQTRKFDHITPVLYNLHWPPVSYRTVFKILLLVFKSLNNLFPSYLADRLSYQSHSRVLRSASKQLLDQPWSITKTYGDNAF